MDLEEVRNFLLEVNSFLAIFILTKDTVPILSNNWEQNIFPLITYALILGGLSFLIAKFIKNTLAGDRVYAQVIANIFLLILFTQLLTPKL